MVMGVMGVMGVMAVGVMAVVSHVVETPCSGCYSIFPCVVNRHLPEKGLQICAADCRPQPDVSTVYQIK